jgi:hypothetical protein
MYKITANGTLPFYWSLVVLGVMVGMNIIITILMAGFERASQVSDRAAPTFTEFMTALFYKITPDCVRATTMYTRMNSRGARNRFRRAGSSIRNLNRVVGVMHESSAGDPISPGDDRGDADEVLAGK